MGWRPEDCRILSAWPPLLGSAWKNKCGRIPVTSRHRRTKGRDGLGAHVACKTGFPVGKPEIFWAGFLTSLGVLWPGGKGAKAPWSSNVSGCQSIELDDVERLWQRQGGS
tara:strand:- start:489 stop:818 length:330 start_codon:yes stop_codon:yes gene_type:complete